MKKLILSTLTLLALTASAADKATITVTNTLKANRSGEMVEVNADRIKKILGSETFIITDAEGKEVESQLTANGSVIFAASVSAKGKTVYYAKAGTPTTPKARVHGRLFTERQDEFGWENDVVAYRIYGHGGAVGYDLFNKSTTELMLDHWYASEQDQEMRRVSADLKKRGFQELADQVYNAYCYHIDHGKGMDCYTVGPTLGGGANALVNPDGTLALSKTYKDYKIIDNGPLRFSVELTYPEAEYQGQKVTEKRVITIDAGSHFCRADISYAGLTTTADVASGVVVHKQNPNAYVLSTADGYVGYEDLGDIGTYSYINKKYHEEFAKAMGQIYVGTLYPQPVKETKFQARENGAATGHAIAVSTLNPGQTLTYYFGSGWNRNPDTSIKTLADWEAILKTEASHLRTPLKVSIK